MAAEFAFEVEIEVQAPVADAFAFFENPGTMLLLPGCVSAIGTIGTGGTGELRYRNGEGESINTWRVVEFDEPRRCVLAQTVMLPESRWLQVWGRTQQILESNSYEPLGDASCLRRSHFAYRFPDAFVTRWGVSQYRRSVKRSTKQGLVALAKRISSPGSPAQRVDGRDHGQYFTDQS